MRYIKPLFIIGVVLLSAGSLVLSGCSDLLEELGLIEGSGDGRDAPGNDHVPDEDDGYGDDDGYDYEGDGVYYEGDGYDYDSDSYVDYRFFVQIPGYEGWQGVRAPAKEDDFPNYIGSNETGQYEIVSLYDGQYGFYRYGKEYRLLGVLNLGKYELDKFLVFDNGWICDYRTGLRVSGMDAYVFDTYDDVYNYNPDVYRPYRIRPQGGHVPTHIALDGSYYRIFAPYGETYSVSLDLYDSRHFIYGIVQVHRELYLVLDNGWLVHHDWLGSGRNPYGYILYYHDVSFYYGTDDNYRVVSRLNPELPEEPKTPVVGVANPDVRPVNPPYQPKPPAKPVVEVGSININTGIDSSDVRPVNPPKPPAKPVVDVVNPGGRPIGSSGKANCGCGRPGSQPTDCPADECG